jgi:transcriptional regulator with XRE-family HTH domain
MADQFVVDIGDRIRRARIAADVTQAGLAKAVGLSRPSIANAETGNQNLTVAGLRAIALHLGVTVAALIGEQELALPPRVRVSAAGWVVRCDECGLLDARTTKAAADDLRAEHLQVDHAVSAKPPALPEAEKEPTDG